MSFKRFFSLLLLFFVPFLHQVHGAEYDQLKVAKIDILPETISQSDEFDATAVRSRLKTKFGGLFSQMEFDNDLKCLAEEYDRIEPALQVINGEIYITLRIWNRPTIRTITF